MGGKEKMVILDAFGTLWGTLLGNDFFITLFAILTGFCLFLVNFIKNRIKKDVTRIKSEKNKLYGMRLLNWLTKANTVFVTFISVFPLLGMLGTVCGLLRLDLATGNMENIKANFFVALTSTAWGIIWSVFYKIIYAFHVDGIEKEAEELKNLLETF